MSGNDIYRNFTEALGSQPLAGAAAIMKELVAQYEQQADEIIELTKAMESAWQGDAAGVAQRGAGPLVIAHALAAPQIDVAQDLSARQVGSFGDAKNSVVPVPDKPVAPDPWPILSPNPMATYAEQVAEYNAKVQHNVDVMSNYGTSSMYNTVGLPSSYGSLADDSASVAIDTPDDGPVGPRSPRVPDSGPGDVGPRAVDQPRSREPIPGPSEPQPGTTEPVEVPPRQVTEPGGFRPPVSGPGGPVPPVAGPGGGGPGSGGLGGEGLGVGLVSPVAGPGSVAGPGGGRGGGWSGGDRLAGRGGLPGGGDAGGVRGGVGGPGAVVSGEGVRGARGGVPVGGVGAGKGRGADDEEHERASFLQDPDPEATFGTNERTAPSVIE